MVSRLGLIYGEETLFPEFILRRGKIIPFGETVAFLMPNLFGTPRGYKGPLFIGEN